MIREALAGLARQPGVGNVLARTPVAREAVHRLVGGESAAEAVDTALRWADQGYWTALEWVAESSADDVTGDAQAWVELIDLLIMHVDGTSELVLVPELLGNDGVTDLVTQIAQMAHAAGVDVTLGASPTTDVLANLAVAGHLAEQGIRVRVTVPASWRIAESLCKDRADQPIRLVKGTRSGPQEHAFRQPIEIDKSFVRCAKALVRGSALPSFSTHDERLIDMVEVAAARAGRFSGDYEFTFFLGRQERLAARLMQEGHRVRLYVPFGPGWYGRFMAGLAEQSSSVSAAVRSLLPGA